jgi:hypothetical protein
MPKILLRDTLSNSFLELELQYMTKKATIDANDLSTFLDISLSENYTLG